jgi:hypothetical protein
MHREVGHPNIWTLLIHGVRSGEVGKQVQVIGRDVKGLSQATICEEATFDIGTLSSETLWMETDCLRRCHGCRDGAEKV